MQDDMYKDIDKFIDSIKSDVNKKNLRATIIDLINYMYERDARNNVSEHVLDAMTQWDFDVDFTHTVATDSNLAGLALNFLLSRELVLAITEQTHNGCVVAPTSYVLNITQTRTTHL